MARGHHEPEHEREGYAWADPPALPVPIETERLVIRPLTIEDAPGMHGAVDASRDHLLPWLAWARETHRDLAESTQFVVTQAIRGERPLTRDGITMGVFDRADGDLVGATGLHDLRRDTASCETGYWLRHDRCGEGLMTETMRHWISALLRPQHARGFGLARVRITCSAANTRSTGIPERLGLRREVRQLEDLFIKGVGVTDRLGWGVLAHEWDCQAHAIRPGGSA